MHYACGYIPHVLLKRYEVMDEDIFSNAWGTWLLKVKRMTYLNTHKGVGAS